MRKREQRTLHGAVAAAVTTLAPLTAAAQSSLVWWSRYAGPNGRDESIAVAAMPDGGAAVAGRTWDATEQFDMLTIVLDADGAERWRRIYDGPLGALDHGLAIDVDAAGNVYILGESWNGRPFEGGTGWDYVIIKYGPDGTEQWVRRYNGPGGDWDSPSDLAVDDAGNVHIVGGSFVEPGAQGLKRLHLHMMKYDTSGEIQWEHFYDTHHELGALADRLALGDDGALYATGIVTTYDGGSIDNLIAAKVDPEGELAYVTIYNMGWRDRGHAIEVDAAGAAHIAGRGDTIFEGQRMLTLKLTPAGEVDWAAITDPLDGGQEAYDLAVDAAGNVYAVGILANFRGNDGLVASYGPDGSPRWLHIFDEPESSDDQWMRQAEIGPDGLLYVNAMAQFALPEGYDFALLRYTTDGELVSKDRFDLGSHSDVALHFTFLPGGDALMTGQTYSETTGLDVATARVTFGDGCRADLTGDGSLDFFDFLEFQNLFAAGDPRADFTGDGALDFFDFLAFQNEFAAGCS